MAYTKKNPFLNEGDAVYGEHFNNSSLLAGMFSMIGQVNIPKQFESGVFNTSETHDKALFLKVALENLTGTNNGDNIVLNSGQSFTLNTKVVLSLFKSWKRFNITGSNIDVNISLKDDNDNLIMTVNNNQELKNYNITNDKIKVLITANTECNISNILFEVTTKKWDNQSTVTIPQEQITGLKEWEEAKNQQINNFFDMVYPIGIIVEFSKNVNPNTTMKGEWKQIKDKFTLASGDIYSLGSTGGSSTHVLSKDEMPVHTHTQNSHTHTQNAHTHNAGENRTFIKGMTTAYLDDYMIATKSGSAYQRTTASGTSSTTANNQNTTATNQNTGNGAAHNNMPPYQVVNKWERIN